MSGYAGCATAVRGMRECPSKEHTIFQFLSSISFSFSSALSDMLQLPSSSEYIQLGYMCIPHLSLFKNPKLLFYKIDVFPESI